MIELIHGDCLKDLPYVEDNSVDVILTDPPYKYLKGQKLEVDFDEIKFFNEAKRILKKSGFIVLFGRGTSFYRWNTILSNLGFIFKEEVIWNKRQNSIPAAPLHRMHETVSIHTVKTGKLVISKIPYIERKQYDIESIIQDVKRLSSALKNDKEIKDILHFLETGEIIYTDKKFKNFFNHAFTDRSRGAAVLKSIIEGVREKSIIEQIGDHYTSIHPTQKPVRLIERLLRLVSKEGDLVLDPFAGSFSTAEACIKINRQFKGWEIDEEYYRGGRERILKIPNNLFRTPEIISTDLGILI